MILTDNCLLELISEDTVSLLLRAEKDIITVYMLINQKHEPADLMYSLICFYAKEAVKKQLAGYILSNNVTLEWSCDIGNRLTVAARIDGSFPVGKVFYPILNKITDDIIYKGDAAITESDLADVFESLSEVSEFLSVKSIRSKVVKKYKIGFFPNSGENKPFFCRKKSGSSSGWENQPAIIRETYHE